MSKRRGVVIICRGMAAGLTTPHVGEYLVSFDVEAHGGMGHAEWTTDPERAWRFDSAMEAYEVWTRVPACHPKRLSDGLPNRPLTAYTIEIGGLP